MEVKGKNGWGNTYNRNKNRKWESSETKPSFAHLQFNVEKKEMVRFEKAFVGVAEKSESTYNMQEALHPIGLFQIKATLMGLNLYLLEETNVCEVAALIKEASEWVSQWFSNIHP